MDLSTIVACTALVLLMDVVVIGMPDWKSHHTMQFSSCIREMLAQ